MHLIVPSARRNASPDCKRLREAPMPDVNVPANVESLTIDAVVTRRDGTVEDLGRVVEYHRDPERSVLMAEDGVNQGSVLGQYRIEVSDESGTSHYGPVYSTR